ncbi:MAG: hypothetical protein IPL63_19780 [Saprospiraceae bacterium]|nr:hypothetical protein [Saprospiraceae bacterium]
MKTRLSKWWDINSIDQNSAGIYDSLILCSAKYGEEYKELIGQNVNKYLQSLNYDILYYREKYGDSINTKLDSILIDKKYKNTSKNY